MVQKSMRKQIERAIENGFRRFNIYDLERFHFSCEIVHWALSNRSNKDFINVILVAHSGNDEADVCTLSDLYFSHECEFLRFVVGEGQYLEVARKFVGEVDVLRIFEVNIYMHSVLAFGADPTGERDSTDAIQRAINAGGAVLPSDSHVTGNQQGLPEQESSS